MENMSVKGCLLTLVTRTKQALIGRFERSVHHAICKENVVNQSLFDVRFFIIWFHDIGPYTANHKSAVDRAVIHKETR